jgi:hypothetical protein
MGRRLEANAQQPITRFEKRNAAFRIVGLFDQAYGKITNAPPDWSFEPDS